MAPHYLSRSVLWRVLYTLLTSLKSASKDPWKAREREREREKLRVEKPSVIARVDVQSDFSRSIHPFFLIIKRYTNTE
jgi:hypothetical protein